MPPLIGDNNSGDGVRGTSNDGGAGVRGIALGANHFGVIGESQLSGAGAVGIAASGDGVQGTSNNGGAGVRGIARGSNHFGVIGESQLSGAGAVGIAASGDGVQGTSNDGGAGVRGIARGSNHFGVIGESRRSGAGVAGIAASGDGVQGTSTDGGAGVRGIALGADHFGVIGESRRSGAGVVGTTESGDGVRGTSTDGGAGVRGVSHAENHAGVVGENTAGGAAALFFGNVSVTGDIFLTGADCAEDFDLADPAKTVPGAVMVLDDDGKLRPCSVPYDRKVAGVVSGAGGYRPGVVLDKQGSRSDRMPIALVGKAYCNVDAGFAPIGIGDLLTTSLTPGHAMRADDPAKSFGAVIGKALRPLPAGQALIPILIALQ